MSGLLLAAGAVDGEPSYTSKDFRQLLSAIAGAAPSSDRPFGASSGVRPGTLSSIVSVTSTTWTVGPHAGVIDKADADDTGAYTYKFDADQTGDVTAADASNARIDRLDVQFTAGDGSTTTDSVAVVYTEGVAASSPVAPTAPDNSFPLGEINVPKAGGGDPTFTWKAPIFSPLGVADIDDWNDALSPGVLYVGSSADNDPSGTTGFGFSGFVVGDPGGSARTQVVWRITGSTTGVEQWQRVYSGSSFGSWLQTGGVPKWTELTGSWSGGLTWRGTGYPKPSYSVQNGWVHLKGQLSTSTAITSGNTYYTLPSAIRTTTGEFYQFPNPGAIPGAAIGIDDDGSVKLYSSSGNDVKFVCLDAVRYPLY